MAKILYLVHRIPYPPNKGDKVRSFNILKYLASSHQVYLGAFVDDAADEIYAAELNHFSEEVYLENIDPKFSKIRALSGFLTNESLTECYYRTSGMQRWVNEVLEKNSFDAIVIFSSAMAQFIPEKWQHLMLVDFVDVDSMKWSQYGQAKKWPMSWVYGREGRKLLSYEKAVSAAARHSFFVTEQEAEIFKELGAKPTEKIDPLMNGVDSTYFSVDGDRESPFEAGVIPIVFTGAMDYWPNVDAVKWFAEAIFPKILGKNSAAKFYIVGRNPHPDVAMLATDAIVVTGGVPDIRPYLQYAAVVVAPLRIARGIQNKILEAMAMEKTVVSTASCASVIGAVEGREIFSAADETSFVEHVQYLIENTEEAQALGKFARNRVLVNFSWQANLSVIDKFISLETP